MLAYSSDKYGIKQYIAPNLFIHLCEPRGLFISMSSKNKTNGRTIFPSASFSIDSQNLVWIIEIITRSFFLHCLMYEVIVEKTFGISRNFFNTSFKGTLVIFLWQIVDFLFLPNEPNVKNERIFILNGNITHPIFF